MDATSTNTAQPATEQSLGELIIRLEDPSLHIDGETHRAQARARLVWEPQAGLGETTFTTIPFTLEAPENSVDPAELKWYLEQYGAWLHDRYVRKRAREVEEGLEAWGRALYDALRREESREALEALRQATGARRISVEVDPDPPSDLQDEDAARFREAATQLFALPWELLHDGDAFLTHGQRGIRIRRCLPVRRRLAPLLSQTPVRILLVSSRPEEKKKGRTTVALIDHRVSALPLLDAMDTLGKRAELKILPTATYAAFAAELKRAADAGTPYDVIHFDGHGIYDAEQGCGVLLFEHPGDQKELELRRAEKVTAEKLAEAIRGGRMPLVVLEACQSARSDVDPVTSVAGRLLREGVASVVAMSHTVMVVSARIFAETFYRRLSEGATVGAAFLDGQNALRLDAERGRKEGALRLLDWFVPVLYQEVDLPLVEAAGKMVLTPFRPQLHGFPDPPEHEFVGRRRELLALERLLVEKRYAVLLGEGGEGKTTLATELTYWLVRARRFQRAVFVSVEDSLARSVPAILSRLGNALVGGFDTKNVGNDGAEILAAELRARSTLIVFDNLESLLGEGPAIEEPDILREILLLVKRLSEEGQTRIIFTTRTSLPAPFQKQVHRIGRLDRKDAVTLLGNVLEEFGERPTDDARMHEVERLVDAAGCHARSLVLLAREVGASGVRGATERMNELMEQMAAQCPDDRECSLYASVELSLRRLTPGVRAKLGPLGVFHGGGHLPAIAQVLSLDGENGEELLIAKELIGVGLAESLPHDYLRLHPALPSTLLHGLEEGEKEEARKAWVEAMKQFADRLYQERFKNTQQAADLTLFDLPNLLAALDLLKASAEAERVIEMATDLEGLLQNLERRRALERVVKVREETAPKLKNWSHAAVRAESAKIDRLLQETKYSEALSAARSLLKQVEAAGESAYEGAAYDLAKALLRLGRVLVMSDSAKAALVPLDNAYQRFLELSKEGHRDAERMAAACLMDSGNCFTALKRLDEAVSAFEKALELSKCLGDERNIAVGKFQLATIHMLQQHYGKALTAQEEALEIFENLGEPKMIATAWHQIGRIHEETGRLDDAEDAYRQSLEISVQTGNLQGAGTTMNQLGRVYTAMGRLEHAVSFYQDAIDIAVRQDDQKSEGVRRSNLADKFLRLKRYDEAREEILRAIECKKSSGHAAEPWVSFHVLYRLERTLGHKPAAAEARKQAMDMFRAHRLDNGENLFSNGYLITKVGRAISSGEVDELAAELEEAAGDDELPEENKVLVSVLQRIVAGERDVVLASTAGLHYADAVELELLLEGREGPRPVRTPAGGGSGSSTRATG